MLKQPDENESQLRAMAEDVEKRIALINEVHAYVSLKLYEVYMSVLQWWNGKARVKIWHLQLT